MTTTNAENDNIFSLRDLIDKQLQTCDDIRLCRVADIEAEQRPDGSLVLTRIATGPQALAGRLFTPLRSLSRFLLRDRFEHYIELREVAHIDRTLHLRGHAANYTAGQSERWLAAHLLRWLPGSGYK